MYIEVNWSNIPPQYHAQFNTYRWTTGYGEKYDYESIMHYSSRAFVRDYDDKGAYNMHDMQNNKISWQGVEDKV